MLIKSVNRLTDRFDMTLMILNCLVVISGTNSRQNELSVTVGDTKLSPQ